MEDGTKVEDYDYGTNVRYDSECELRCSECESDRFGFCGVDKFFSTSETLDGGTDSDNITILGLRHLRWLFRAPVKQQIPMLTTESMDAPE